VLIEKQRSRLSKRESFGAVNVSDSFPLLMKSLSCFRMNYGTGIKTLNSYRNGGIEFRIELLVVLIHKYRRGRDRKLMDSLEEKSSSEKLGVLNYISNTAKIGKNVKIWHFAYIGDQTRIEDNVVIGSLTHVDYNVSIGENTRIEGSVYIPPLTVIGKNVFVGPGATFTNDPYPMSPKMAGVIVNDGAIIGGRAVIKAGLVVGRNAVVAMGSVVTRDVPANVVVIGCPAKAKYSRGEYDKKQQKWNS
jgi:UDP-2-acetamido-3-amino-2,3-dideoxy-glucuronate N-acetyltransferase